MTTSATATTGDRAEGPAPDRAAPAPAPAPAAAAAPAASAPAGPTAGLAERTGASQTPRDLRGGGEVCEGGRVAPLTGSAAGALESPAAAVPAATVPAATVPVATVPAATVPAATVPAATVPAATVPVATVPVEVAPAEAAAAEVAPTPPAAATAPAGPGPTAGLAERTGASQTPGSLRGGGEVCGAGGSAMSGTLRRVLVVGVAGAAVVALVFGVLWVLALSSGSLALARDRDAVLVDARQAAINLNTLDYRNVDAGLDLWQQSSTGSVLAEFQQNRDQYAKLVQESKRTTVATVPDAAVTELDERAGVARVLVAVDVTVTPDGQPPAVTRQRLQMEMTRTPDGWKVSKLSPVRTPSTGAGN